MNTQYLKYALEIERTGTITQAAQNLYMAQPNLSRAIRDLEEELGYDIFKRTASGIVVTEKGEQFLFHAKKIMNQLLELEKLSSHNGHDNSRYKISIPRGSYIASGYASFVSALTFSEKMEITINETSTTQTISNVTDRGYNIGIIRYPVSEESYYETTLQNNHLERETLWEFEYVLVMSKRHPLAEKSVITKDDLKDYVQITHGDVDLPHTPDKTDTNLRTIFVYERGSQFDLLANVPSTYMWVSPIPTSYLEKNNLVQRACSSVHNRYKDVLIYSHNYQFSDLDKLFQQKLYESKIEVSSVKYD